MIDRCHDHPRHDASAQNFSVSPGRPQRAERTVRRVRDELEVTVRERTATLRRTNEELQAEIAERARAEEALGASEERWRPSLRIQPSASRWWMQTDAPWR